MKKWKHFEIDRYSEWASSFPVEAFNRDEIRFCNYIRSKSNSPIKLSNDEIKELVMIYRCYQLWEQVKNFADGSY